MAAKTAPRVPKPLLVCQNWFTKADGYQNLVPGLHSYRRGPAWSVIYNQPPPLVKIVARFFEKFYLFFIMYFIFRYFS